MITKIYKCYKTIGYSEYFSFHHDGVESGMYDIGKRLYLSRFIHKTLPKRYDISVYCRYICSTSKRDTIKSR